MIGLDSSVQSKDDEDVGGGEIATGEVVGLGDSSLMQTSPSMQGTTNS
jgi:hypothetical protein